MNYDSITQNENSIYLTDDADCYGTFDQEEYFYLNPDCTIFMLRSETYPLPHDRQLYKFSGINIEDEARINAFEFLRLLDILYHEKLLATENEICERISTDFSKITELYEWFHPDVVNGELPSENETFKRIAKVLETGNAEYYQPTHKPNTHWTNWLDGGNL